MSPEPTQAHTQNNLDTSNVNNGVGIIVDSESEDEEMEHEGYMPLSSIPNDHEEMESEDSDEVIFVNVKKRTILHCN